MMNNKNYFVLCILILNHFHFVLSSTSYVNNINNNNPDLNALSPTFSRFIGPQPGMIGCNKKIYTIGKILSEYNLCYDDLKYFENTNLDIKDKAVRIGLLTTGAGGFCSFEKKYSLLVKLGVSAIISITPGVAGAQYNGNDGTRGEFTINKTGIPLFAISEDALITNQLKENDQVYISCDENPWKKYYEGPIWTSINLINAIGHFFVASLSLKYAITFMKRVRSQDLNYRSKQIQRATNMPVLLILVLNFIGCLAMGIAFVYGFGLSTPYLPAGIALAYVSMLSGIYVFALIINAIFLQEYTKSIIKLKAPDNILVIKKIQIILWGILLIGFDAARQLCATFYISVPELSSIGGALYTIFGIGVSIVFTYHGEKFLHQLSKSNPINNNNNNRTSKLNNNNNTQSENINNFITRMTKWLRICSLCQIILAFSIIFISAKAVFEPTGGISFAIVATFARLLTSFAQTMSLRPVKDKKEDENNNPKRPLKQSNNNNNNNNDNDNDIIIDVVVDENKINDEQNQQSNEGVSNGSNEKINHQFHFQEEFQDYLVIVLVIKIQD